MTISTTKSLTEILANPNSRLGKLISKTTELCQLNKLFHSIVDPELSKHCQLANLSANTLTLIVDNAAWATRLRFNIPELIKTIQVQPEFRAVKKIRYKVSN